MPVSPSKPSRLTSWALEVMLMDPLATWMLDNASIRVSTGLLVTVMPPSIWVRPCKPSSDSRLLL